MVEFKAYLEAQDRSSYTVKGYLQDLSLFARWFSESNGEAMSLHNLTTMDIREYRKHLHIVKKASPATINRHLAAIRAYCGWGLKTGQIESNPSENVRGMKEQKLAPKWLDKKEQNRLLREVEIMVNAARTDASRAQAIRDQAIIVLMLNTGLRIGELCALELSDIELSSRKGKVTVRNGKGSKARVIPLNNEARKAIRAWLAVRPKTASDKVFTGKRSSELTPNGVQRRLVFYGQRASVRVTPHTLRHTFAKRLVDEGVSLEKVAALLGHSNLNTTKRYITPGEDDLERAVERLED